MKYFLAVAVLILVTVAAKKKTQVTGRLTVNGVTCQYHEKGTSGRGPRGIILHGCDTVRRYCTYYGANPHHCGRKYNAAQIVYYKALAMSAMENGAPCANPNISESICGLTYPCYHGDCQDFNLLQGSGSLTHDITNNGGAAPRVYCSCVQITIGAILATLIVL